MVALLPYRGNDRNFDQRCPIDIVGLAKIHNAVTQFKIDNEHGGNFIQHLQSSKAVYKAAQAEWSGWQQYLPKHAARARNIEKGPREKPVIEGQDELVVNPPLLMRKGHVVGKMKCALTKSVANQGYGLGIGLPFLERFSTAHAVYAMADLKKLSVEGANNFQNLVYLEIQYLASCCTLWETVGPNGASGGGGSEAISAGGGGGSGSQGASGSSLSILGDGPATSGTNIGGNSTSGIADNTSGGGDAPPEGEESGGAAAAAVGAGAKSRSESGGGGAEQGVGGGAEQSEQIREQLCEISRWDHRSGEFPLNDDGLRQMAFPEHPKPKYYYAAALILFLRASRTDLEESVFQHLSARWCDWFNEDLTLEALKKGAPRKGPQMYTAEEINWCEVRLQELDKEIQDPEDRERLGLPPLKRRGANREIARERERTALLEPAPAQPAGDSVRCRPAKAAEAAPAKTAPAEVARAEAAPANTAPANTARSKAARKRKHADANDTSSGAAGEVTSSGGTPTKEGGSPGHGAGVLKAGRMVSVNDGRLLVRGVELRRAFPNNYRNPDNTNRWRGHKLELGQAFKLACFVHYGPRMPYEKSGDFETRKALFRTAAYYAMSPEESDQCMENHEFVDFINILVATAKQMKYVIMTEGRIFFGDNVFTSHRASRSFHREYFFNVST